MDWSYESDKQIMITFTGDNNETVTITNEDVLPESFSLTERICSSDQVEFGTCEASEFHIMVANSFGRLKGKELTVQLFNPEDSANKFMVGKYKVVSDKIVEHGTLRELVAYDKMYELSQKDVWAVYNSLFREETSTTGGSIFSVPLYRLTAGLSSALGITVPTPTGYTRANLYHSIKTPSSLMATDVLKAIGELTGGSYHFNRDGSLGFVSLLNLKNRKTYSNSEISEIEYQDYTVKPITKVTIQNSEDGTRYSAGSGSNEYLISGNLFLTEEGLGDTNSFGNTGEPTGSVYAQKLQSGVSGLTYTPVEVEAVANLTYEVGSLVRMETLAGNVDSIMLQRTVRGIQGMMDSFSADGEEEREADTSIQGQIDKSNANYRNVITHYLATSSDSGITRNSSGWTTTVQTITSTNKYLWTYNTYVRANGTTEDTVPIITGVYGSTGAKGDKGDPGTPGAKGDTGNGIANVRTIYYTSNSSTTPSAPSRSTTGVTNNSAGSYNAWNLRVATFSASYPYVYTCQQTYGTDGYYVYSTPVLDTFYSSKIKAAQIDTSDLFAQNITASNMNITGGSVNINSSTSSVGSYMSFTNSYADKGGQRVNHAYFGVNGLNIGEVYAGNQTEITVSPAVDGIKVLDKDYNGVEISPLAIYVRGSKALTETDLTWTKIDLNLTSGSKTFDVAGYSTILLKGQVGTSDSYQTIEIPVADLTSTNQNFAIANTSGNNTSITALKAGLKISGTTVTITWAVGGVKNTGAKWNCVYLRK